jgi:hypothetical protein
MWPLLSNGLSESGNCDCEVRGPTRLTSVKLIHADLVNHSATRSIDERNTFTTVERSGPLSCASGPCRGLLMLQWHLHERSSRGRFVFEN